MSLPVAILAGGLATRMHPLTEKKPKSLIRVADDYFISHQLHYLCQQGISQIVLCLGHLGKQIEEVVGNGSAYHLEVRYSWDGPCLLGTGGALKQALPLLGDAFFVLYGDSYLPLNFADVEKNFYQSGKPALLTAFKNDNQWDKSNIFLEHHRIIEYNKHYPKPEMRHIDYGLSLLSSSILNDLPLGEPFDLADLYHDLSLGNKLAGYEVFERFYEIGSLQGLKETISKLKSKHEFQ